MPVRIILGIGVTVVGFGIAAVRFHWLSRLIRSGQPDPGGRLGKGTSPVEERADPEPELRTDHLRPWCV